MPSTNECSGEAQLLCADLKSSLLRQIRLAQERLPSRAAMKISHIRVNVDWQHLDEQRFTLLIDTIEPLKSLVNLPAKSVQLHNEHSIVRILFYELF